jgi:predicted RNA-binding protein with PUA-like domain
MSGRWLVKTEPRTYSYEQLVREGKATWDGVRNPLALGHMRAMKVGDEVMIYHSGKDPSVVGVARVTKAAYPDPKADDPKMVVVDLVPLRALGTPIPLARIKADKRFADLPLVRISRLSVMPIPRPQWDAMLELEG